MNLSALLVSSLLASAPSVPHSTANPSDDMPEVGVPFSCGRIHTVSQGHDTGSHQHNDTYAWDFRMPDGTPIVAARDGVVRLARGDSTRGAATRSSRRTRTTSSSPMVMGWRRSTSTSARWW
jgi:hypothetical protein